MDATQQIEDSFFGEEDESDEEEREHREPLAVLKVFKNNHIPESGEQISITITPQ